jgi:hypothetical protein
MGCVTLANSASASWALLWHPARAATVRVMLGPDGGYRLGVPPRYVVVYLLAVMGAEADAGEGRGTRGRSLPSAGLPAAVVLGLLAARRRSGACR